MNYDLFLFIYALRFNIPITLTISIHIFVTCRFSIVFNLNISWVVKNPVKILIWNLNRDTDNILASSPTPSGSHCCFIIAKYCPCQQPIRFAQIHGLSQSLRSFPEGSQALVTRLPTAGRQHTILVVVTRAQTSTMYTVFTRLSAAPDWAPPPNERRTNYFQMRRLIEALSQSLKTLI